MNQEKFNKRLDAYLEGKLSEKEKEEVELWLDSLKQEDEDAIALSDAEGHEMLRKIKEKMHIRPEGKTVSISFTLWMKIAASLLLLVLASYYAWINLQPRHNVIEITANGEVKKVILNDSSIVWLRGQSKLTYYELRGESGRFAELDGEGLFEITKDSTRPFAIQCGSMTVRVLGTSFNLKTGGGNLELKVLTGKVNLSSTTDTKGIDVIPNQKVIYKGSSETATVTMSESEVASTVSSTEYNMNFDHTAMQEILRRVQAKFNVRFIVENEKLRNCTIKADVTDQSLRETLRVLAGALDFEYQIADGTVTLRGGGCQ